MPRSKFSSCHPLLIKKVNNCLGIIHKLVYLPVCLVCREVEHNDLNLCRKCRAGLPYHWLGCRCCGVRLPESSALRLWQMSPEKPHLRLHDGAICLLGTAPVNQITEVPFQPCRGKTAGQPDSTGTTFTEPSPRGFDPRPATPNTVYPTRFQPIDQDRQAAVRNTRRSIVASTLRSPTM